MLNWNMPASRPRYLGGAISEMYKRRGHRRDADAQAADDARDDERGNIRRETPSRRADKVQHADPQQRRLASKAVRRPAAEQRAEHRAVERRGHRDPVQSGAQSPKRLDRFFRAGDDDGVEAEQKSGERGGERPEKNTNVHR